MAENTLQPTVQEMAAAEDYLRKLALPVDAWLLDSTQQYFTVIEVVGKLFGLDEYAIRGAAGRGEIPYSVMPTPRVGWRLDRNGLVWYVYQQRRKALRAASGPDADEIAG